MTHLNKRVIDCEAMRLARQEVKKHCYENDINPKDLSNVAISLAARMLILKDRSIIEAAKNNLLKQLKAKEYTIEKLS